ncbi:MAG: SulP family inorganic anion transporter [Chloroflexales bacterium]|nr:SulP family inorganic anion transporter [Chloroflexales bacterium]
MLAGLKSIPAFFLHPIRIVQTYQLRDLRPDLVAGLTMGVVSLPQGIAFALLAGLPPQMGLYTVVVGAIVGALWGSSIHLHTGPTNTSSILTFSALLPLFAPGSPQFIVAAGLIAVIAGVFRVIMGLARLGVLVRFVSDSVIVGFSAGVGVLIISSELRNLFRIEAPPDPGVLSNIAAIVVQWSNLHWPSFVLGIGVIVMVLGLQRLNRRLPGALIAIVVAATLVSIFNLDAAGLRVLGQIPQGLPPLAPLPIFDLDLVGHLSTAALAIAIIGLVEATSVARAIAIQSGQRLDANQEFIGQGLANIACGILSGYGCSSSFNRSALNYKVNARTPLAAVFSGAFVLIAMLILAPLAAEVPRAALAAILIATAFGIFDRKEIARIMRGAHGDALIMIVTLLATVFLPLQFAVLSGILMALAYYLLQTSTPRVQTVLPDAAFQHLIHRPDKPNCPQLGIIDIFGDLYFGAVEHIEIKLRQNLAHNPTQRFLLLRMQSVHRCDISGIHMLESIVRLYRERGGDVFLVRIREPVLEMMQATGFYDYLGASNVLPEEKAISHIFYKILDPAICIYECEIRAFLECQNLPKRLIPDHIALEPEHPLNDVAHLSPGKVWRQLQSAAPPLVIDVREPREFKQGHIPQARLIPLLDMLANPPDLPYDHPVILVCRSGRRSARAARLLVSEGHTNVRILQGGMIAWQNAGLLEAIE